MAEGRGFELLMGFKAHIRFPGEPFRPLTQPSMAEDRGFEPLEPFKGLNGLANRLIRPL